MSHSFPARDKAETTGIPFCTRGTPDVTAAAVDLDDLNSPHTLAVLSVAPGASVLDIGCGPGVVARALATRGCRVWGLEIDPRKAALARHHCVEVVEADVESAPLSSLFGGMTFDAVLYLDVLEHLREPAPVLAGSTDVLAPGGSVLLSIPNVTHGALRLELLKGRFRYRNSGLLDRGHLRFFDAEAVHQVIRQAGLRPESTLRVIKRLDQTEFDVDLENVSSNLREMLERDADALTYQFFVIARRADETPVGHDGASLIERLRARTDEVSAELDKAGAYSRHLEAELASRDDRMRQLEGRSGELGQLAAELEQAGAYARHLEAELAARQKEFSRHLEARSAEVAQLTAERVAAEAHTRRLERDLAASRTKAAELEQRLGDLTRLMEDHGAYARHLERELQRRIGEIAVRDDEMSVLRVHIEKTERAIADRDAQLQATRNTLAATARELEARTEDLVVRREEELAAVSAREADLEAAASALAENRALATHLSWMVHQPRHRLAGICADELVRRAPWLHRLLRPLVLAVLARVNPSESTEKWH
jgi:2-polyprenyl-3-methyl-5-hydroxy-6-metoxy-1,4-benzoquinol methylase